MAGLNELRVSVFIAEPFPCRALICAKERTLLRALNIILIYID